MNGSTVHPADPLRGRRRVTLWLLTLTLLVTLTPASLASNRGEDLRDR